MAVTHGRTDLHLLAEIRPGDVRGKRSLFVSEQLPGTVRRLIAVSYMQA